MDVNEIRPGVIHISFKNQYHLTSTMMRLQEYYENPDKRFRRNFFTYEQYMDWNAAQNKKGRFDYFDQVEGCNVPDHIIKDFFRRFQGSLWEKEKALKKAIGKREGKFYLIATYKYKSEMTTIKHELAHAYYYLYPKYKREMLKLWEEETPEIQLYIYTWLTEMGYCQKEFKDESQAYLSTATKSFWYDSPILPSGKMKEYFSQFDKEHR